MLAFKDYICISPLLNVKVFILNHTNVKTLHDNDMDIVLSVSAYFHKMHVIKMII